MVRCRGLGCFGLFLGSPLWGLAAGEQALVRRFSTREVVTGGRMIVARPLPEAQMLRARARWRKNHRLMRMDTGIMDPRP